MLGRLGWQRFAACHAQRTGPKGRNVDRAVRMERDDLQRELFTLFDEEAHWRLSEIVRPRYIRSPSTKPLSPHRMAG